MSMQEELLENSIKELDEIFLNIENKTVVSFESKIIKETELINDILRIKNSDIFSRARKYISNKDIKKISCEKLRIGCCEKDLQKIKNILMKITDEQKLREKKMVDNFKENMSKEDLEKYGRLLQSNDFLGYLYSW